jgi:hypothetical protein
LLAADAAVSAQDRTHKHLTIIFLATAAAVKVLQADTMLQLLNLLVAAKLSHKALMLQLLKAAALAQELHKVAAPVRVQLQVITKVKSATRKVKVKAGGIHKTQQQEILTAKTSNGDKMLLTRAAAKIFHLQ